MYQSASFCAAGSAMLFLTSVASWVFALAREIDGVLHQRRSPRQRRVCLLRSKLPCLRWRRRAFGVLVPLSFGHGRWEQLSSCARSLCAFWVVRRWLAAARSHPSRRAIPATVKKQDSERKHRFIPWPPCETHVANTVENQGDRVMRVA